MTDSNRRHPRCKRGALPTELIALREAEAVSAASVAVIYAYRQKTARAEWKIFLIFFSKSRDRLVPLEKSDVENRPIYDGRLRGGLGRQNMMEGEALRRGGRNFFSASSCLWKQFGGCHGFVSKPA